MHIEFYVEEPSTEQALLNIVPKILGSEIAFKIYPHQGKLDLLGKLPARLLGYRNWLPEDWRIVVLVDGDNDDCRILKAKLEEAAHNAGLVTQSAVSARGRFQVLNRLAIEELEAWFFGDIEAIQAAYPRIDRNLGNRTKYRDPDAVPGGTWEALERELQRMGYFRQGLGKITAAREISAHMNPERNRSHSFQVFRQGLIKLIR